MKHCCNASELDSLNRLAGKPTVPLFNISFQIGQSRRPRDDCASASIVHSFAFGVHLEPVISAPPALRLTWGGSSAKSPPSSPDMN